eukprot:823349-Amphidinium_carterae.1
MRRGQLLTRACRNVHAVCAWSTFHAETIQGFITGAFWDGCNTTLRGADAKERSSSKQDFGHFKDAWMHSIQALPQEVIDQAKDTAKAYEGRWCGKKDIWMKRSKRHVVLASVRAFVRSRVGVCLCFICVRVCMRACACVRACVRVRVRVLFLVY